MPTVLLVAHHYPPHVGGLEVVVEKQAHSLAANGYQVVVLTSRVAEGDDAAPAAGVDVIRIGCSHFFERKFFIPFPLFSPRLICEAWRQLGRADIVHIHDVFYVSSWVVAVLAAVRRKPMLLTQHVAMVEHPSRLVMGIQKLVYATAGRFIFSRARCIVAYNDIVRAFLRAQRVPDDRVLQLINGIDVARFHPATDAQRREIRQRFQLPLQRQLVLFVGRLVEKKGSQILFAARDPGYDVVFVGPGDVATQDRVPGVHWLGALPQAQIAELFRACDVFAFPAVGEIFTLVMQEAMASGLPVVTTDDPAYHGSIVEGRVVLCPRTPEAYRGALRHLFADPEELRRLGAAGRELAERHFDWHVNFGRMMNMYSEVLRGGLA